MKLTKAIVDVLKLHGFITVTTSTDVILERFDTLESLADAGFVTCRDVFDFISNTFNESGENQCIVSDDELEKQAAEASIEEPVEEAVEVKEVDAVEEVVEIKEEDENPKVVVEEPIIKKSEIRVTVATPIETVTEEPTTKQETVETVVVEEKPKPKKTTKKSSKKES